MINLNPAHSVNGQKKNIIESKFRLTPEITEKALLNILEDVQSDAGDLEKQRVAIFNILDDVNVAQIELKDKYAYINTQRSLLEKLTLTIDVKDIMYEVVKAYEKLIPFDSISYIISNNQAVADSSLVYIYSKTPIGRSCQSKYEIPKKSSGRGS